MKEKGGNSYLLNQLIQKMFYTLQQIGECNQLKRNYGGTKTICGRGNIKDCHVKFAIFFYSLKRKSLIITSY